jgi:hypothetical protein
MINWPQLPGTMFPCGPPGTPGLQGATGPPGGQGNPGPPGPSPWSLPSPWATGVSYTNVAPASLVVAGGNLWVCTTPHVSGGSFDSTKFQQVLSLVSVNFQVPTTGFNITMAPSDTDLILDPAGTLSSGTVTMCLNPYDGQVVHLYTSQTITSLTIAGNGKSVRGAPTTWAAPVPSYRGIFRATNNTWYF